MEKNLAKGREVRKSREFRTQPSSWMGRAFSSTMGRGRPRESR